MSVLEGIDLHECLAPHVDHQLTVEGRADGVNLVCHTCNRAIIFAQPEQP